MLLWVQNSGGDLIYHVAYIGMAFIAGFGGETILGKAMGQYQMGKEIPLLPFPLDEKKPEEKKEEPKEEKKEE